MSDVTPQLDYAQLRARAMESLFGAFDSLCEGTVVVDRDARVVWINERYAARFGVADAKRAIGKAIEEIIPTSLMREVVRTGKPLLLDILDVDGESFVVTRIPLKDERGETIGAIGFALFDKLQPLQPFYARLHRLQHQLAQTRQHLAAERRAKYTFSNYIGNSPAAAQVKQQARRAARLEATVLLLGETGTGKELLAHAIHAASTRAGRPFVGFNVAAIPETLLEAECFGAAPGAYTGADRKARVGKFELADGGTLFLDEIGDMPPAMQAKLLRVLQESEVEPLGSNKVVKIDVRIIAATSRDLRAEVAAGRFRADLYYRLNVLAINLPPLRERIEDFGPLCDHILEQIAARTRLTLRELDAEALALLKRCRWPGNIRELRNVLEQACMLADGPRLTEADIRGIVIAPEIAAGAEAPPAAADRPEPATYDAALAEFERELIARTLQATGGKVTAAAKRLGLGRATLYKKIAALGIVPRDRDASPT
ncbi:MAG: sigma 54-interacting transcriptional regulator [Rhodocyclaceae bacterium]|nr:sigma 54-interacting transcriptional regulator [Rhodocyclaceae bacterium]